MRLKDFQAIVGETRLDFPIEGFRIVLVDDVLYYPGRTIRATLDAIVDFGRPQSIQLLVLADRGTPELPIEPQYVGHRVETERNDSVKIILEEVSGKPLDHSLHRLGRETMVETGAQSLEHLLGLRHLTAGQIR